MFTVVNYRHYGLLSRKLRWFFEGIRLCDDLAKSSPKTLLYGKSNKIGTFLFRILWNIMVRNAPPPCHHAPRKIVSQMPFLWAEKMGKGRPLLGYGTSEAKRHSERLWEGLGYAVQRPRLVSFGKPTTPKISNPSAIFGRRPKKKCNLPKKAIFHNRRDHNFAGEMFGEIS